ILIMERPSKGVSFLLLLCWLGVSWEARLPRPLTSSNATIFSHVYTIKVAGEDPPDKDASPPPQEALGPPGSSRGGGQHEHTLEGSDQEHVVFTHRINLPPQSCGCPPGTEDTRELWRRLQALESEVRVLQETCQAGGGCCPAAASTSSQASEGQTDIRTLCSHHGSFDLSRCLCECESGWGGPTCAEPVCSEGCGGAERGSCVNGHCQCQPGYSGVSCEEPPSCPDDCNDQGRCVEGRCTCFPGYVGPSCSDPVCPQNCHGHGQCISGGCVCNPGYTGTDCATRACPSNCNRHGECRNGRCVCEPGFTGPACGTKTCPNDCNQRGHCLQGGVCTCHPDYTGPDCGQLACLGHCSGHGECQNGTCVCNSGYSGEDCSVEIPSIGVRVSNRDETSFRLEWNYPEISVDGYEIYVAPTKNPRAGESTHLSGTERIFEYKGLKPGEEYTVTVRVEKGQHYGPPVTQTVRTRVAPPNGLHSSQVSENSLTLQWEPPTSRPDGYVLSYVPLSPTRPVQAMKRVELPAVPERVTLEDLESRTRYRITLVARQSGENSRATSIVVSTTAPAPIQPSRHHLTPTPSSHKKPDTSSSEPEEKKPGTKPHPGRRPANTTLLTKEHFLKRMTQNISSKLSPYNGTLLERLESYLRAIRFPLRGNQTIQSVARDIYLYLKRAKPIEFQEKVEERLVHETSNLPVKREFPVTETESVYSEGYLRPDHAKPTVVTSSPDHIEVSLDSVRGISDHVVIRYRNMVTGEIKELVVPGNASTAIITGLSPGTTYLMEIHGVMKGHSSKSYSFITATAPSSPTNDKIRTITPPILTPLKNLQVTEVSPNQLRDAEGKPKVLRMDKNTREATISNLVPSRKYRFNFYVILGRKPFGPVSLEVVPGSSSTFKDVSATVTSNSAHLSWTVFSGTFDSFLIQYKDAEGRLRELSTEGDSHEITIPDLAPSHRYTIDLYGISNQRRLGPASITFITGSQEDVTVHKTILSDLAVSEVTSNSVHLTWKVPTGRFDSFLLQYQDLEGSDQALPMDGDSREAIIPNLGPSQRYRFNLYGILGTQRFGPIFADAVTAAVQEPKKEKPDETIAIKPSLGEFSVLDVTSNSVHLYWTVPTGSFDSFLIQYKDADGQPQALPVEGGSHEVTVTNLVPSRRYKFNLYGVSGRKRSSPLSTDATTAHIRGSGKPIPVQPSLGDFSILDVTSDSVRLHWTVPTGSFDSFLIQYKDADGQTQMLPVEGSFNEVTVTNLVPSRRYKFNLYGVSGRKRSTPLSTDATTVQATKPEKPASFQSSLGELSALDVTSDSVRLHWTVPTGSFDSFLIQYKDASGQPQALPVEGGSREITVTNLVPSRRYKFNLYGVSGRKRSNAISTFATTVSEDTSPLQPSLGELSVLDVTSDSVRLHWTVPTGSFDSFLIQYKDADGQPQALPVEGGSTEVTVTDLAPSRRYKFNLYGVSGKKRSRPLTTEATTVRFADSEKPVPVQPSLGEFSVLDATSNSVRLYWTVPTGSFDSFLIQYKDADGQPQALPVEGGSREVAVTDLAPSHRYKFNLYGVSGHKRSSPLSTDATTVHLAEEPVPTQLSLGKFSVVDVTSNSVRLHWTVPSGTFDSFLIHYKNADGQPQELPIEGDSSQVTVTNLAPSHIYKFNLYGISGHQPSSPLSTDATTTARLTDTEDPIPVQPSLGDFSILDVTSDSVRLQWTIPTGRFDSFLVQYKDADGQPQALPVEGGSHEVIVTNLAPSRRYKFNLYGVSGRKRSGPLSIDATTTDHLTDSEKPIPAQPSLGEFSVLDVTTPIPDGETAIPVQPILGELSVFDITSDSVRLYWTVSTGSFDSFLIQYKDADGQPQMLPVEGGSREVTVTNLVPSRRYKFNLYGVSGRKRSSPLSTDATTVSKKATTVQPSLGEFSVLDVTSDSVRLHWTVPTGNFDSFLVQYKDADGQSQALPVEGVFNEVTVTDLVPLRRYKFNLYGVSGRKRSRPLSTDATTAHLTHSKEEISNQPSLAEFSVLDVTSDSVHLHWTVPTGNFDSFLVQYKDADGQPQALPVEGSSQEVTVTNLVPSRRYKFNLYGILGHKRSQPLSTDATTAHLTVSEDTSPLQPSLGELSVLDVTSDSIRLHWTVPTGSFDSFLIQYKDADSQPQALPVEGGSTEVTVTDLAPSRRYKFNLYGVSGKKRSRPLTTEATTAHIRDPGEPIPVQPSLGDFSVLEVTSDSVRLHWTVPTGSFDSFLIQYKDTDGQPRVLPVEGSLNEVTVTSLAPSHQYKFNLYGVSGGKRSSPLSIDATTAHLPDSEQPVPVQPSLGQFSVVDVTSDSVRLHWTVPTGSFDSFLIQYKDADGQSQALPVEGGVSEVTVTNLAPSHRYKFNLHGVSGRKRSSPLSTDATTAQITEEAIPIQPSLGEFSVLDVTRDSVRLHWTVLTGNFDSFLVQYKDADGQPQALPVEGSLNEVTVTNLAPSRRYKFNLYGVSGHERSSPLSTDATTAHLTDSEKPIPAHPSLGEFSVLDVTSDSVRLHWTVPTGRFDSFLVQYKDADGQPQALPVERDSREVTLTDLAPSRRYKFNLYGISGQKRSRPLSTDATTAPIPDGETAIPVQPSLGELSVFDITSDSVRLYWTVSTGSFDSFLIQYKDADGQPQMLPVEGGSREVTVTNLAPSRRYKFNLYGVSGRKRSTPLSTEATTDPGEPIPVQPSLGDFSVLEVTSDSVRLHWTVPTGSFDSFLIQYKDADGQSQALPVEGSLNEVTVTNLAPLRRYKFNLYGVSGRKRSGPLSTDATTAQTTDSGEAIPVQATLGELSVLDITSNSVRLHWTVPAGTFDSFLVQYKDADGQPQVLPVEGGSREVTVSNLAPSHRYKFLLYGVSGRKKTSVLSANAFTDPPSEAEDAIPVQPSLGELSVLDVTSNSVRLHWTVPTGSFDSFLIQYKDADGQPQALPVEGGSTEVTVTNLAPSRRYKFNLYGVSGRKRSRPLSTDATTARLTDSKEPVPVQPSLGDFTVLDVTSDSVRLHWTVPTGTFDSFLVQYKDADGQPQALPVEGDSREVTLTKLVPSRRYKFNLYGVSGRKRSGPLSTDATTSAHLPDLEETNPVQTSLGEFSVLDVTSDSVRLYWTIPSGSFDSFLIQYKDADGQPQALPIEGSFSEVTVTDLVPSHRYEFNLYGVSGRKRSSPLSTDAITAPLATTPPVQPSLGELSVSNLTHNSALLSWTVHAGNFDSFMIQYKDVDGKPQAVPVEGNSYEVLLPNLVPGRRYRFNLYGVSGRKRLGPVSVDAITASTTKKEATPKPSLGELSISEVSRNSVLLSWTVSVGSFDSFLLQYKDEEGRTQTLPVGGDSYEVAVLNLTPSHKYKFNLYGISGQKRIGPISSEATTEEEKEEDKDGENQPSLGELSISETTSNSLHLSWSVPTGSFDSFLIQYEDGALQSLPVDGASRETVVSNLTPSHNYQFDLYGISGGKRLGPISAEALTAPLSPSQDREESGSPGPSPNPSFGELSVSDVTSNSVRLSWNVPAETFDSFQIQYKDAENKPQMIPVDKETNTIVIYYLVPTYRYKFNLYGISGRRRFGPITVSAITAPGDNVDRNQEVSGGISPRLGGLSVSEVTSHSARLSWTIPEGSFDAFSVQYKDAEGRPQALPLRGDSREVIVSNLSPSHKYKFNLYGIFGKQRLGPISAQAVTTAAETSGQVEEKKQPEESTGKSTQPNLGNVTVSEVTPDSLLLSWNVQEGHFDSFIIQYKDAAGKPQAVPVDGNARDVVISNLVPSHIYKFNLYGISQQKRFGPVSTEAVTAQVKDSETKPKLGDLSISGVTNDSVRLSWTVSSGRFDSFLIRYKDAQGNPQNVPVGVDSQTVFISNLIPSHKYKFSLFGISGKKQFGPVSIDAVTAAFSESASSPAPLLSSLVVSEVTSTTLQLSWDVPEGEFDSFVVRWKDNLGSGQTPVPAKEVKVPGDERSVTLQGLAPSTEYSLTVYGIKDESEVADINTGAKTSGLELDGPQDLRFSDIHETSVVTNWSPPSSRIDGYKVSFQPSDGGEPKSISVDGSELRTFIEGLTPGASYEVAVMSIRGFEESEPLVGYVTTGSQVSESVPGNRVQLQLSELQRDMEYWANVYGEKEGNRSSPISATFTTGADGPRDLHATEISPRSAHLIWSPPRASPEGYLLSYETPDGQSKEIPLDASVTSYELQDLIPSSRYQVQVQAVRRDTPTAPISTSFTTGHLTYPFPRDCSEEIQNGPGPSRATTIYLGGNRERPLRVFCDMETDGGGWIVFQRRMNGETDFWRDWQNYALGFGNLTREFWLGNDALHQLTSSGDYELRVDLRARDESVYATYQSFRVDPPADYYRLHLGSYHGTAGDSLSYHSGSVFSTRDRDPNRVIIPCAISYRGAWWYRNCHYTNLNGLYANNRDHQGVNWFNWKGFEFSIPFTEMKLRPSSFRPLQRS
ncbi:tenascin-X, partial [Protobothrops mucrosquamatus]|uniref:tenascin-X n=1 Tax=Protobothrops mucrosquamatus TaxID=103944 RepID=UPI00077590E1